MVLGRKGPSVRSSPAKARIATPRAGTRPPGPRTSGPRSCLGSLAKPTNTNVKVVVRVRPPNRREDAANAKLAVKVVDEKMLIFDPKEEEEESFFFRGTQQKGRNMLKRQNKHTEFLFDRVFGHDSTNKQVFEESTKDIIAHVLDGYNCSVFVYGATGAGKTYTMLGTRENPGVMFLTMEHLFERMEQLKHERDIEMAVSYLEVYNENVHDLTVKSDPLFLREDANGVVVSGLKVEKIRSTHRLFELLAEGNKNRTQHPTDANSESSRSHAVFQVYLKMCNKGSNQKKMVKLSMIDLAGSERGSATNFAGARFKEGSSINKSLLALGNCINKLADGLPHIPYRDSKLTRILKDSLSGNCRTVMIANVSPCTLSLEDTHNTLRYAKRAKLIKSVIKKNIVSVEMHVSHYIKMVDDLKEENARLKAELQKAEEALTATRATNTANPVYMTPVKTPPVDKKVSPEPEKAALSSLLKEVERVFAEKVELQRRYLQVDSNEKVLMFRMQCKERSVARVQLLCETPTNTEEAKFRLGRSMKQFTGQLKSAVGCQEGLADMRNELDSELKGLRQQAASMGLLEEFLDKTAKMDLQFQNVELKEQLNHLNKVIILMNKEKDDQDQVMTELSAAFRNYYNLLRGHGHMTEAMLKDHKSLVRRLEGLKSVYWETAEEESTPVKLTQLSLTASPEVRTVSLVPKTTTPVPKINSPVPKTNSPVPKTISPVPKTISPVPKTISPVPKTISPVPKTISPVPWTTSPVSAENSFPQASISGVYRSTTCDIAQFKQDLNCMSVLPTIVDMEKPAFIEESDDDEDFCVSGKFAQFNATFDRLPTDRVENIDAAISKVDDLLNESGQTFGGSEQDLNKTYEKTCDTGTEKTTGYDMNRTFDAETKTFEGKSCEAEKNTDDAEKRKSDMNETFDVERNDEVNKTFESTDLRRVGSNSVEEVPSKRSPKIEAVDMNSTYQLPVSAVSTAAKAGAKVPLVGPPKTVPFSKKPKLMMPKKPLQENNFSKPKAPTTAYKWRLPPPLQSSVKNQPVSARAILERNSPVNKVLVGNKENGAVRRPFVPPKSFTAGGSRGTTNAHSK